MTGFPILSASPPSLPVDRGPGDPRALRVFAKPSDAEAVKRNSRWIALWTTLATLALSVLMVANFDPSNAGIPVQREPALVLRAPAIGWGWTESASCSSCSPPS